MPGSIADTEALLNRWTETWEQERLDLVDKCVAPVYIRNEPEGRREVTPDQYREEIRQTQARLSNIRFHLHDQSLTADRIWIRYTMTATDVQTGNPFSIAGTQVYRVVDGRLAETWVASHAPGTSWDEFRPDRQ
jgi:hypothetical protein